MSDKNKNWKQDGLQGAAALKPNVPNEILKKGLQGATALKPQTPPPTPQPPKPVDGQKK
jgi:hypothetical protein